MNQCYQGIDIPVQIQEPCGNTYISTNCVTIPESLIYLDLPAGSSQTEVNENIILALQAISGEEEINQDNFVRDLKIEYDSLPDPHTKQDIIDYILSLPAGQRTILDTDSKWNILFGFTPEGEDFIVDEVYELQNTGKGIITSITEDNLLFLTGGLQNILDINENAKGKQIYLSNLSGSQLGTFNPSSISFNESGIGTNLNNTNIQWTDSSGYMYISREQWQITSNSNSFNYIIKTPDPSIAAVNGLSVDFPIDMTTSGVYTLAIRKDLAETVPGVTSPLSLATLNGSYSFKPTGFRLQCPNIVGGAIIYEKTSIGWLSINATIVT